MFGIYNTNLIIESHNAANQPPRGFLPRLNLPCSMFLLFDAIVVA